MLISQAFAAQATPAVDSGMFGGLLPMVVIVILFYFMLIRPQAKRAKEQKAMLASVQKGDEVVTVGGVVGKVTKAGDQFLALEIADNVQINVQRVAIQTVLPKGTIKTL